MTDTQDIGQMADGSIVGGHGGDSNIDRPCLEFFQKNGWTRLLDIGCGPGKQVLLARSLGFDAYGVEGDANAIQPQSFFHLVDYRTGQSALEGPFDIGWSIEFVEHVPEAHIPNFMADFVKCARVVLTAAPPGWGGEGHVNEQNEIYWIEVFNQYGFALDQSLTDEIRAVSSIEYKGKIRGKRKQFVQNRGLFFVKSASPA